MSLKRISGFPSAVRATRVASAEIVMNLYHLPRTVLESGSVGGLMVRGVQRFMALCRRDAYWVIPSWGQDLGSLCKECQFLLLECEGGRYELLLPLAAGELHADLQGDGTGIRLSWRGAVEGKMPEQEPLLCCASGPEPFALIETAAALLAGELKSFRVRQDKTQPAFADYLGWCTWDAFYHAVDQKKVLTGLRSFRDGGVMPGFMILDDGWLSHEQEMLTEYTIDKAKFPKGLAWLVRTAKEEFGVSFFGIWHCFVGYWLGIHPKGQVGQELKLYKASAHIRPWLEENPLFKLHLVEPSQIGQFYAKLYRYFFEQGVDMIKADGQSSLDLFVNPSVSRGATMKAYQEAFQSSGALYMNNELLHCMSHGSDVLYNCLVSNCMRNSADYLPRASLETQQYHVVMNAYNALLISMVAIPDWDMFQTHAPGAQLHAAARAISGGPLYVCDYPGKQDFALLDALCISGGRILRCSRPALPAAECLFEDCHNDAKRLLKITNKNDAAGVVGLFHVSTTSEHVRGMVGPSDVHDLQGKRFAVWYSRGQRLETVTARKSKALTLEPAGWELVHFVPIVQGVAALGLLDKLNCAGAVRATSSTERGTFVCVLEDGSERTGFYCENVPSIVLVNGRSTRFSYDVSSGLLELKTEVGRAHRVEIG